MEPASLTLDPGALVGPVSPRLYGSFLEHLGRAIYSGVYEPGHPAADADGFRSDVLDLVRELAVPIVRYPGGNFVSGYAWEDGVGPRARRPRRLDLAWRSLETNRFGTDEFVAWCRKANAEPMLAVNLGSRGLAEARDLLEYCNHPGGTRLADLRIRHGARAPHGVKVWCLGNEMDGEWQIGHKTAAEYGRLAAETAKVMRAVDPTVELVACGSSNRGMPTFPAWERTVLDLAYDTIDYVSLHTYLSLRDGDLGSFLAAPVEIDRFIAEVIGLCDAAKAAKGSKKTVHLAFDEWNVWYHSQEHDRQVAPWQEAPPLLEDAYTLADAVVAGGMLLALLRRADRVRIGCLAQLVNVIAPIVAERGGPVWRQTIFWPFLHASRFGRGAALAVRPAGPAVTTKAYGDLPALDAAATWDEPAGAGTLFAINRRTTDSLPLEADLRAFPGVRLVEHLILAHSNPEARNSAAAPAAVAPRPGTGATLRDGALTASLPACSWNVFRFTAGKA